MRYFWTFFWTFLLMQMMAYVVSSMTGVAYNFVTASILAVVATVLILILGEVVPDRSAEGHH
ncbi:MULTISPECIES: YjzD family protein [Bacillaceae]|uniref:DUF2929 family protein n=1 Tax=Metabacillus idriensis TaxID=324768 RepID=A0A6I2M416_9BACI|nr:MULTISPECIES: YjzD family protein [Bacillaceae]OHR72558.1 hypothetical protein HMPREF3291_21810 [Bacillus sp. HMSC76G11]MCM3595253.1 YjzD family protein [Metabacillus idriensis]MDR0136439.1 YjzD family protein [Metabacillus idriensis]MRX52719.1 DUF2929 family protein [Metabacillus idriensis]TDL80660.1 DUF2929 family protein [Peribacillus frigoritolerans]